MRTLAVLMVLGLAWGAATGPGTVQAAGEATVRIASPSALLMEAVSGRVLWEKDADRRASPASVTKLMTLFLAYEALAEGRVSLDDRVVASEAAASLGGTQIWLYPGEEMPFRDILLAVAVGSANDAAVALAEHVAGSEEAFVALMNRRAEELGLGDTRFANCHGLDAEDHYTSTRDVARLSRELVLRFPQVLELTSQYLAYVRQHLGPDHTELANRNRLVRFYPGADGLKTGWTRQAGYCVAVTACREGTRLIVVVMASASRTQRDTDARILLNYGFGNFAAVPAATRGEVVSGVPVRLGVRERVELVAADHFGAVVPRGKQRDVQRVLMIPDYLTAPVRSGSAVGELALYLDGKELGRVALLAGADVPALTWSTLFVKLVRMILR